MIRILLAVILFYGFLNDFLPEEGFLGLHSRCQAQTAPKFSEGKDFATQVLHDPWNMDKFSGISQYINQSGQQNILRDIKVENGLFSARSVDDAQFYPLFPGYMTAMLVGKVGHNYPIRSGEYKYLYMAMKVDSRDPTPPDMFQIFWFADELQNSPGGVWGSSAMALYPESLGSTPTPTWKLYKVDLTSSGSGVYGGGTPWTGNPTWQGLRIDPTIQANINFQVDWVRLTDGNPVYLSLSFTGSNGSSVWIRPAGTAREILIQTDISSPYNLDLQGIPPGTYAYIIKNGSTEIKTGNFEINQSPIVNFINPSPTGGEDYATLTGNSWDMGNGSDAVVECAAHQFKDGLLQITTPTGAAQPEGCWGGWEFGSQISDSRILLNIPRPFNPGEYRYLSFRMYTEGPWQDLVRGMMARWIWTVPSAGGNCYYISQDIPFDVGWQTYTIDLFDAFNGSPEMVIGGCPATTWRNSGTVSGLRFDPNENILGYPLNQFVDWIKLYKEDVSAQGSTFPVRIYLNKPPSEVSLNYYYTSDTRNQPTQHMAQTLVSSPPLAAGQHTLFLPLLVKLHDPSNLPPANSVTFNWDTSGVTSGAYYICVTADDSLNNTTYCSDTPTRVI